ASGQSIRVDNNGGVFITGSYYDVNTGTSNDIRLIKYDYSGNLLWQRYYDFGNSEFGKLINIDSRSNIFITGSGALPGEYYVGWLISKFDSTGNLLWYNRVKENHSWEELPHFALVGPQDEIYVTGNIGVNIGGTTYHGLETVRYNSNGDNEWISEVNQYAGIGKGLSLDNDLNLFVVGQFYYSVIKYSQLIPTSNEEVSSNVPEEYYVAQNYPNPFNPSTTIKFDLPNMSDVTLKIFNILGEEITTLVSDRLSAGSYSYDWDASNLAGGVYLYRLQAGQYVETRKMVLLR
ncbi:MAG: T9SS type A sorting domain-containing protein, partial [bacterium]